MRILKKEYIFTLVLFVCVLLFWHLRLERSFTNIVSIVTSYVQQNLFGYTAKGYEDAASDLKSCWFMGDSMINAENKELKTLLSFVSRLELSYITTSISSINITPYSKVGMLSAGEIDGVVPNSVVVNNRGLVGIVSEVYKNSAQMIIITDPNLRIPVVTTNTRRNGVVIGNGCDLRVLYMDTDVEDGELITTSNDSKNYLPDIPIGTIRVKDSVVYAEPLVDIKVLRYVSILKKM